MTLRLCVSERSWTELQVIHNTARTVGVSRFESDMPVGALCVTVSFIWGRLLHAYTKQKQNHQCCIRTSVHTVQGHLHLFEVNKTFETAASTLRRTSSLHTRMLRPFLLTRDANSSALSGATKINVYEVKYPLPSVAICYTNQMYSTSTVNAPR